MRRGLVPAVALVVLVVAGACAGSTDAAPAAPSAADLRHGADLLREELTALAGVREAEVTLEQDEKSGRAVRGTVTASGDAADLLAVLDRATELGWDTEVFVPQAVELRVVGDDGVELDATDLGFPGRAATLTGLHERYGAPAADPDLDPAG